MNWEDMDFTSKEFNDAIFKFYGGGGRVNYCPVCHFDPCICIPAPCQDCHKTPCDCYGQYIQPFHIICSVCNNEPCACMALDKVAGRAPWLNKYTLAQAYRDAMANHYGQYVQTCNLCGHLVPVNTACETCLGWFEISHDPNLTREAMLLVKASLGVVPRIFRKTEDCG